MPKTFRQIINEEFAGFHLINHALYDADIYLHKIVPAGETYNHLDSDKSDRPKVNNSDIGFNTHHKIFSDVRYHNRISEVLKQHNINHEKSKNERGQHVIYIPKDNIIKESNGDHKTDFVGHIRRVLDDNNLFGHRINEAGCENYRGSKDPEEIKKTDIGFNTHHK